MIRAELLFLLCWRVCTCREMLWVLVNRQDIQTAAVQAGEENMLQAEYGYLRGDTVDVSCVTTASPGSCRVSLKYDYVEDRLLDYANTSDMWMTSRLAGGEARGGSAVGWRATLLDAHHRTSVLCACAGGGAAPSLTVTFVLQTPSDELVNLTMNGLSLRPQVHDAGGGGLALVYTVHYVKGECFRFRLTHNTDASELSVWVSTRQEPFSISTSREIEVMPNSSYYDSKNPLTYAASDDNPDEKIFVVHVYFEPLSDGLIDASSLEMDVPVSRVILKVYEWRGDQRIYYEFEDGDVLSLKCNTSADVHYMENHVIIFGDSAPTHKTSVPLHVNLSTADDGAELACALSPSAGYRNKTKQIRVIFCRKNVTTTGSEAGRGGVLAAALGGGVLAALACIALVAVLLVRYCRRRTCTFRSNRIVDPYDPDASIPLHPMGNGKQREAPAADHRSGEHTYSEVQPAAARCATEEVVTTPELNYAELDITPSNKTSKVVRREESPYAEVQNR